jgi:hypothetical protein
MVLSRRVAIRPPDEKFINLLMGLPTGAMVLTRSVSDGNLALNSYKDDVFLSPVRTGGRKSRSAVVSPHQPQQSSEGSMPGHTQVVSNERSADDGCNINLDYSWVIRFVMRHPTLVSIAVWLGQDLSRPQQASEESNDSAPADELVVLKRIPPLPTSA